MAALGSAENSFTYTVSKSSTSSTCLVSLSQDFSTCLTSGELQTHDTTGVMEDIGALKIYVRDLSNLNVVNVYTVTFTKEALPTLNTLSISGSTGAKLDPSFAATTYAYDMPVPFDSSSVCFTMSFDTVSYSSSIQMGGGAPLPLLPMSLLASKFRLARLISPLQ